MAATRNHSTLRPHLTQNPPPPNAEYGKKISEALAEKADKLVAI